MANLIAGLLNAFIGMITKEGSSHVEALLPQDAGDLMTDIQKIDDLIVQISNLYMQAKDGLLQPPSGTSLTDFLKQIMDVWNDLDWFHSLLVDKYDKI